MKIRQVIFLIILYILSADLIFSQYEKVYLIQPEFMQTIIFENNYLKECECIDKLMNNTKNIEEIDSCNIYIVHRHKIYNSDSSSLSVEPLYKRLIVTYKKDNDIWIRKEFKIDGELYSTSKMIKNPDNHFDKVDTICTPDYNTGELIKQVITYYDLIKK